MDLALVKDTHKFESRYLDGLIGPWPERSDLYRERSPIHHSERLSCPVAFFQGLEDRVVPPNQAEAMVAALAERGIRHHSVSGSPGKETVLDTLGTNLPWSELWVDPNGGNTFRRIAPDTTPLDRGRRIETNEGRASVDQAGAAQAFHSTMRRG